MRAPDTPSKDPGGAGVVLPLERGDGVFVVARNGDFAVAGGVDADGGDVAVAVAAQGDDAVAGADFKPGAGDDAAFRDEEGGGHGVVEGEGGGGWQGRRRIP